MIDTHAHLYMVPRSDRLLDVIARCKNGEFPPPAVSPWTKLDTAVAIMTAIIVPGTTVETSIQAVTLANEYRDIVHAAVGIHPTSCGDTSEEDWLRLEQLAEFGGISHPASPAIAASTKVVAIGETGLDRYWDTVPFGCQVDFFHRHLRLARRLKLPVLIHCRDAHEDLMPILRKEALVPGLYGVVHAFSGDWPMAVELVELGFHISFAGAVTYTNKKFDVIKDVARRLPLDRILLETDSPFIVPHPYRGKLDANEPVMTAFVAAAIAELRQCSVLEIIRQTTENAVRLFDI